MKDRNLPASFWQQPDRPSSNIHREISESQRDVLFETRTMFIRIPTPPDTNLLFSLFKILDQSMTISRQHIVDNTRRTLELTYGQRQHRRLKRNRKTINDRRSTNNNNNNSNQAPDLNTSAIIMDENNQPDTTAGLDHQDIQFSNTNVLNNDEDECSADKSQNHPEQCFSDDDPYLCVGSKDRRVGGHQHQQSARIRGCGDNFSDLLSDLVVNL